MLVLLAAELALLLSLVAGWAAGRWLVGCYTGAAGDDGSPGDGEADSGADRLSDTIGFVGGAYGILLGLLLVFAVGHFVEAREVTKDEAATAAALFSAVHPYPADVRDPLRHDLICYLESVARDDWAATRAGDLTGSENTTRYAAAVQEQVEALPQDEDVEASNHYFVTEELLDLATYRQLRLLNAVPEIPPVIWVVLLVSAFLFLALTVFRLGQRRWLRRVAVGSTALLLVAIVGALIQLDAPYLGVGTSLQPVAIDAVLTRLRDANPEPASLWSGCERRSDEEAG